jgi:hypothetical protein
LEINIFRHSQKILHPAELFFCTVKLSHPLILTLKLLPSPCLSLLSSSSRLIISPSCLLSTSSCRIFFPYSCPFWTCNCLPNITIIMLIIPSLSTNIAEFILANTCHVVTTSNSLQHMSASETSFVLKASFKILDFACFTLTIMDRICAFVTEDHPTIRAEDCLTFDVRD